MSRRALLLRLLCLAGVAAALLAAPRRLAPRSERTAGDAVGAFIETDHAPVTMSRSIVVRTRPGAVHRRSVPTALRAPHHECSLSLVVARVAAGEPAETPDSPPPSAANPARAPPRRVEIATHAG